MGIKRRTFLPPLKMKRKSKTKKGHRYKGDNRIKSETLVK